MARTNKRKREVPTHEVKKEESHQSTPGDGETDVAPVQFDSTPFVVEWIKEQSSPSKRPKLSGRKSLKDVSESKEEEGIAEANLSGLYTVSPGRHWNDLRKYRNFVVNPNNEAKDDSKHKFEVGQFIFVNHSENPLQVITNDKDSWVAQVREVRAEGQHAVYVRVLWFYWPEELPNGREVYHGERELVASNYHQIIDAMTVSGKTSVQYLADVHDMGKIPIDGLYWRQTLDVRRKPQKPSPLSKECICKQVLNPDVVVVKCSSDTCQKWQHESCLLDATLTRFWEKREELRKSHTPDVTAKSDGPDEQAGSEDDIGDTIVAKPPGGLIGLATNIGRTVLNTMTGSTGKPPLTNGNKKAAKKSGRKGRRPSKANHAIDQSRPWGGEYTAKLQLENREAGISHFNGKAIVYSVSEESGVRVLADVDETEVHCLFCGLSMLDEDEQTDEKPVESDPNLDPTLRTLTAHSPILPSAKTLMPGSAAKKRFDAVHQAASENAISGDEVSTNGGSAIPGVV